MLLGTRKEQICKFLKKYTLNSNNIELISFGLTHPSYTNENNLSYDCCYERFEFLGDAVLKLLSSKFLFNKYPDYREGQMTKLRGIIVSDMSLEFLAKWIGLDKLILLGEHEKKSGIQSSIIACAFEGFLGALYLTSDLDNIYNFLTPLFEKLEQEIDNKKFGYNAKALLQEYTQGLNKDLPSYELIEEMGPEHNKIFKVEVIYQGKMLGIAEGKTKKDAQQNAAIKACQNLGILE